MKDFKILVVDDSPEILDLTIRTLKKANYTVFPAVNGAECIDVIHREKPDIILLDVILPDVNGKELAKEIKSDPEFSSVFIILLSGLKISTQDISEGLEEGADGYMTRPVNSRELLARVSSACRIIDAERKLYLKNAELQKINAEKDKFFSIIAHDLKSPFNSILGFSELFVEQAAKKDYESIDKYAGLILKSSHAALNLLSNLMEWAQSQTGRMKFSPEQLDLTNLINDIVTQFENTALQKEIVVSKSLPHGLLVFADNSMLSTVLRNLISNAIKFTYPGGKIRISAEKNQNEIKISVGDTGKGISNEVLNKLFQIDGNITSPGTQNETGTGLGLILCKEFVEKHNGKIWVESKVNEGSTFYFTIPVHSNLEEKIIPLETEKHHVRQVSKLKILIVEDDRTSELLLSTMLSSVSTELITAKTGKEAIEMCRFHPDIDLIIMDIKMPEMDGYETTLQIREFNKEVIIIAQTAYALDGEREKALKSGCNDYISKPIKKTTLLELIIKCFGV